MDGFTPTVLIVDANAPVRHVVARLIRISTSWTVLSADVNDVEATLAEHPVDAMLIDAPPESDVERVAEQACETHPEIPVAYMTTCPREYAKLVRAGEVVLQKPFGPAEAIRWLRRLMGGAQHHSDDDDE